MKHFATVLGAVIALTATMPAFADDLTGDWKFDTSKFPGHDCKISGHITFKATSIKNTYTCEFESEQICGPTDSNLYIRVQQSCTAQRVGNEVGIKTTVEKVLERRPMVENAKTSYLADNFLVQVQKNLAEMIGQHYDEQRQLKVRFWRDSKPLPDSSATTAPH